MAAGFFKRLLRATAPAEVHEGDARSAIAAVLVMAARADGSYEADEKAMVDSVLSERYGLNAEDTLALRREGEEAETESIDIYQFTKAIRELIPIEDRRAIVEGLWRVVLADGERDPMEDTLMRQLVERLGLSSMDSALARQKVQGGGSIPV